jgi:hypothetical protein
MFFQSYCVVRLVHLDPMAVVTTLGAHGGISGAVAHNSIGIGAIFGMHVDLGRPIAKSYSDPRNKVLAQSRLKRDVCNRMNTPLTAVRQG